MGPTRDAGAFGPVEVDVLIAGCGPVGVALGLHCARRGLSVLALDRAPAIYDLPRAIVLDEEIQQVLRDGGVEVDDITTPLRGAEFVRADGSRVTGIELPEGFVSASGLPPAVVFEQPQLEERLRAHAVAAGVELALGIELTALEQDDDSVRATLVPAGADADAGTGRTVTARWLIGADGARSTVRKLAGIAFVDQGFDQRWLVVDTWLRRPVPLPTLVQQICDPERPVTFVPGHAERRRWEFQLHDDETDETMVDHDRVAQLLSPWLGPDDAEITRAVVYRFHALVAERFREQRVLLVGDAAHQMPPFNGQGLCSGLRDVANLAWKLELVTRGVADASLLDSYDAERRPHAAAQVVHAADAGKLIDAIAGRAEHGSVEELLDAGYGAGRPFPRLTAGLVHGDDRSAGRALPMARIGDTRLDLLLGDGFGLVARHDPRAGVDGATVARWDALGAAWIAVEDHPWLAHVVSGDRIAIVRPDRYVAAVVAPDALAGTTDALIGSWQVQA